MPWPSLNREDDQWIEEGVTKGAASPWVIVEDPFEAWWAPLADAPLDVLLSQAAPRLPGFPGGMDGQHGVVAPVLVDALVGRYLHVAGVGWHEWVGDRWVSPPRVPVRSAVQKLLLQERGRASRLLSAVESHPDYLSARDRLDDVVTKRVDAWADGWTRVKTWWSALSNDRTLSGVMRFVEDEPGKILVRAEQLDRDPYVLNCPNGTVDLRTGELRPHDPHDLITKSTGVPFDPAASHPLWDKAREAFAPGVESWLQLKVGEGAFGLPSNDDTLLFSFGQGSNGKSTLTDAVLRSLGDYAVFLHDKAILANEHDHGTEKMIFRGARWRSSKSCRRHRCSAQR